MAGSGRAAEYGILFKGGEHLEQTHHINTVVVDKTGTVTNGKPKLTDVLVEDGTDINEFLSLIGSSEKQSEHPLAEAIVQGIEQRNINFLMWKNSKLSGVWSESFGKRSGSTSRYSKTNERI